MACNHIKNKLCFLDLNLQFKNIDILLCSQFSRQQTNSDGACAMNFVRHLDVHTLISTLQFDPIFVVLIVIYAIYCLRFDY